MIINLKNKVFKNFFYSQVTSAFGDWISYVAIPIYIYNITRNPISVAILNICKFLPNIIVTPYIGKLKNKYSSIKIMVFCDLVRGVFFLGYLLTDNTIVIYTITFVVSMFSALFNPIKYSIISKIVEEKEIEKANSQISAATKIMMLIGPAIGGIIMGALGKEVLIIINSLSFFLSLFFILKISSEKLNEKEIITSEKKISYLKKMESLWISKAQVLKFTILFAFVNCLFGALNTLFPIVANKFENSTTIYGYIISILGLGLLIGVTVTNKLIKKLEYISLYSYATIISSIFLFIFGISENYICALVMVLCFSIGNGIQEIASITYIQIEGEEESVELFAISQSTTSTLVLISTSVSAIVTKVLGIDYVITILSILIFILGSFMFIYYGKMKGKKIKNES